MADDGGRIPGCEACQFIGRICLPDCPFFPYFETEWTRTEFMDWRERTVTECARCYHQLELRRQFVEGAVEIFSRAFPGDELHDLLVEAILSEAEKELESPPESPLHSSCSSSSLPITPFEKADDADTHELELAASKKPLEESGTSTGADQNLGVNADQDSIFMADDGGQIPGCKVCQIIGRICPPDCPLAAHFGSGGTHGANFAVLESISREETLIDRARIFTSQERRRFFVDYTVYLATFATSDGEEGHRLLVETILSEAEKELEPPPEPIPAHGSSSSANLKFWSEAQYHPVAKYLNKLADHEVIGTAESATASPSKGFFEGVSMLEASGSDRYQAHGDQDFYDGLRPSDLEGNIRHGGDDYNDYDSDRVDQKLEVNGDELLPENQGKDSSDTQKQ